jgi:CheY-like chemotaxis protein
MDSQWEPGFTTRSGHDTDHGSADYADPPYEPAPSTVVPASILIVEDQEDVRRMLVMALSIEGHHVHDACNADEGLQRLKQGRYQLVLTDYAMPGRTGSSMLLEASQLGLLDHTAAIIITAHPDVQEIPGIEIITKPLDLDKFLVQVRQLLGAMEQPARAISPATPRPVELVLYVSSASAASMQARRAVQDVLADFDPAHVTLTVHDLLDDPLAGEVDHVAFTPTLVRRYPRPRVWLLGAIREPGMVAEMLHACGVEPCAPRTDQAS